MAEDRYPLHVVVYTEPGSVACEQVKQFLKARKIDFDEKDILQDLSAVRELRNLGHMIVPVTRVGTDVIVGFDREALEAHFGPAPSP